MRHLGLDRWGSGLCMSTLPPQIHLHTFGRFHKRGVMELQPYLKCLFNTFCNQWPQEPMDNVGTGIYMYERKFQGWIFKYFVIFIFISKVRQSLCWEQTIAAFSSNLWAHLDDHLYVCPQTAAINCCQMCKYVYWRIYYTNLFCSKWRSLAQRIIKLPPQHSCDHDFSNSLFVYMSF